MAGVTDLRHLLQRSKQAAAGQEGRQFLPNGIIEQILTLETLRTTLSDPSFRIDPYKRDDTAYTILSEAKKVFAILIDLEIGHGLSHLIENEVLDKELPVEEKRLKDVLSGAEAKGFVYHQWEYLAYDFRKCPFQRKIRPEILLPYLEEKRLGGGGYSEVFEVVIHPAHQVFSQKNPKNVCSAVQYIYLDAYIASGPSLGSKEANSIKLWP
jgi:hypothetical protein